MMERRIIQIIGLTTVMCCASATPKDKVASASVPSQSTVQLKSPRSMKMEYMSEMFIPLPPISPEAPAGELLEYAFTMFNIRNYSQASKVFGWALNTGNLNDAGRALCYWHIAQCCMKMGNKDGAAEAYFSFVTVADDIIKVRDVRRFAVDGAVDFVDSFQLIEKLDMARSYLNVLWLSKSDNYGRTLENPIVLRSASEIDYLTASIIILCNGPCKVERINLFEEGMSKEISLIEQLNLVTNGKVIKTFFVIFAEDTK
jgi:hypothetical protein